MNTMRSLFRKSARASRAAALGTLGSLALTAITAGCGASDAPYASGDRPSPAVSAPPQGIPAYATPAEGIPDHVGLYKRIPPACPTLNRATQQVIAPGSDPGLEEDPSSTSGPGGYVLQHVCEWTAIGWNGGSGDWTRDVTVGLSLMAGTDPLISAAREYRTESSFLLGAITDVQGVGGKAQLSEVRNDTSSMAILHILRRNIDIMITYRGMDSTHTPMTPAEMRDATTAAAYSVLAALR